MFKSKEIPPTEVRRSAVFRMARESKDGSMVKIKVLQRDDSGVVAFNPLDDASL